MQLTREQARSLSGGGNSFFKLEEGKSALVRFLYNTIDDMVPLACHSYTAPGNKYPTDILCARETEDSPMSDCKYCSQGSRIVARYIIPMYNEDTQEIQYWVRSGKFEQKLAVHVEDFNGKAPISGQVFKIIRTGSGTKTDYELIKSGNNDGRTKDSFGEIKTNDDIHMIKEGNYTFPENSTQNGFSNNMGNGFNNTFGGNQNNTNVFGGNQGNANVFGNQPNNQGNFGGNPNFTSTRRTTDMF